MGLFEGVKTIFKTYGDMNPVERETMHRIVLANPTTAFVLKEAHAEALRWSRNLSYAFLEGKSEQEREDLALASRNNGPADAVRHCYWSALLASKLAYNDAQRVVVDHEAVSVNSSKEAERLAADMDLHNDEVGLGIGALAQGASNEALQEAVLKALFSGRLRFIDPKTGKLVATKSLQPST